MFPPWLVHKLLAFGVLLYAGTGIYSLFMGYAYLDYAAIDPQHPSHGQHLGILIVEAGVGINQLTNGKQTPLMFACKYQSMEVFRLLMELGADVTLAEPVQNHTALSYARENLDEADSEDERQLAQEMIQRLESAKAV